MSSESLTFVDGSDVPTLRTEALLARWPAIPAGTFGVLSAGSTHESFSEENLSWLVMD